MSTQKTSLLFLKYWIYPGGDCQIRVASKFFEESMHTYASCEQDCFNQLRDMERRIKEKEEKIQQEKREVAEFDN